MLTRKDRQRFERITLPHMDAAYSLALWLVKNRAEADDIVQTAYMRAFEGFGNFVGNNPSAWLMTIVRNTAFNWMKKQKRNNNLVNFDEALHKSDRPFKNTYDLSPEEILNKISTKNQVIELINLLPVEFSESLFLRDIEGYSYKEISEITQTTKGTVMSRLSRARSQLQKLVREQQEEKIHEL